MKRRDFFKHSGMALFAAAITPKSLYANTLYKQNEPLQIKNWTYLGTKWEPTLDRNKELSADIAVIGGGMAGICAAVSAARAGSKVILVTDRPVLGGNASSEIRITVNGVNKDRETGIIEEILLANRHFNPQESYPVWDYVLYDYVNKEPNIKLLLNTPALHAETKNGKIESICCRQLTTESNITIRADIFIDSSGDGLIAADAGAEYRTGREGKAEFNETNAPEKPDGWVMGDTIMMITKDMKRVVPFHAPSFAIPFDPSKAYKRTIRTMKEGYWWVELGSEHDIIRDRQVNREKLMGYVMGVWDYVKNSGKYPESANIALDWIGALPGRRESRRFMGDYILNATDMLSYKHFDDAIGYGGWSLDEHCPGGILNLTDPPSFFHQHFNKHYEIPFRSIYSRNIKNLFMAGRNISVSHIALSSTRIIGTCCTTGMAAGTAANMCREKNILPRDITKYHISELQERMLREDYYIPNRPALDENDLAKKAKLSASSTLSGNTKNLVDGVARGVDNETHHWESDGLNSTLTLAWNASTKISSVELKCDTNLHRMITMHKNPKKNFSMIAGIPPELVKDLDVEIQTATGWKQVGTIRGNITRLIKVNFPLTATKQVRLRFKDTYGSPNVKVFEVRCYGEKA